MKNWLILFVACLLLGAFSCGKEKSDSRDTDNPLDSTGKLVKISEVYLPDSFEYFVRNYSYEPNGKVRSVTTIQRIKETNGVVKTLTGTSRFYRDAAGRIERIGSDPDTSSYNILLTYSSPANSVPLYIKHTKNTSAGIEMLDSVACTYSSAWKLTSEVHFMKNSSGRVDTSIYVLYAYDSRGNLTSKQQYSDSAGNRKFELNIGYSFEYDSRENPLFFEEIGYFFHDGVFGYTASPNNVVKQVNNYKLFPSDQITYSFIYNSVGKPVSFVKLLSPTQVTRFYYE